jgi:hypothetical protein
MDIARDELQPLRFQFIANLADQLGSGHWIVGQPPRCGGVAAGHRVQKRGGCVTRVRPENATASEQRSYQGKSHRQDRYRCGSHQTLSAHGGEYAP